MIEEIIDMLIDEKLSCKQYKELANETENMEYSNKFKEIAEEEMKHYEIIKEYLVSLYE